jgi:hypothetical protein
VESSVLAQSFRQFIEQKKTIYAVASVAESVLIPGLDEHIWAQGERGAEYARCGVGIIGPSRGSDF